MAASNSERKKSFPKNRKPDKSKTSKGETFRNEQRMKRKQDRSTLLTKTPREILALDKGKFKPPSPMTTPVEKRNAIKFCEFHGEVGHTTDECMNLKRQIEEMIKAGKLSHLIKELKQNHEKDQAKIAKKGKTSGKDKPLAILMVQPWKKIVRQRITQTFSPKSVISFPTLGEEDGGEDPMIIEAEMGGHCVHLIYVDGGSSLEILATESFAEQQNLSARMLNGFRTGKEGRKKLCGLLRGHLDVFAWKPADMTRVPRHIAEHRLNVREGCLLVRQKKRGQAPERNKTISEEVKKLVDADIMKEVHYHSWLSNPVMKVESICGYPYKCFMDAYKGYHQIKKAEEDEEKTAFITSQGIFCYSKIPFGLKNVGATYQRLVDKAFQKQIGRNLEVYVDDLIIKSRTEKEVIRDAEETFKTLRKINMKLNPKKCAFGMREGTFLGYKVDADGLRVSPDKVKAVLDLPFPKCLKDVQKLNGKLASLNRFLRSIQRNEQSIAELPMLTAPKEKEELIIYLAAAKEAISPVLMTERDGKQVPIYFVSRALQGPEINYTPMEKLILALVSASKRLKRYFQAHTIVVITDQPIKQLLSNPEVTGRLLKWRFEIGEHDIQYRPRTSVKGQILADFIVQRPEDGTPDTPIEDREELPDPWILFTDGSSCVDGSGAGLIIMNPEGMEFTYALREKAIDEKEILAVEEEEGHTWMTLVYEYLTGGVLPKEKKKARTVRRKAGRYAVINEVLYKKSFLGPWLRCVGPLQANSVLREIHEGSCNMHAGPRYVVAKVLRSAGPSPEEPGKVKFLIVAIDYFTKWIEAKPVATITGTRVKKFVWDNIVCRFGLPGEIISDNGKQFRDNPFRDWCEKINIRQCFASVKHPHANGLVERANRSLGEGIKAHLGEKNKNWVEEVSHVLWAHRTMIKSSNGETPFSLTYGTEAVIPAEIGMPTLRTAEVDMAKNNEALGISLDLLEEKECKPQFRKQGIKPK
nr:reverse transcriptase domain-containing protein [Tanacetum cinerariifolium]